MIQIIIAAYMEWNPSDRLNVGLERLPNIFHNMTRVRPLGSEIWTVCTLTVVVVDVNNLKYGRKPVKLQKESPAGCAGEGEQSKGN